MSRDQKAIILGFFAIAVVSNIIITAVVLALIDILF